MNAVLRLELKRLFATPYGWVLLALFGLVSGWRLLAATEAALHQLEQQVELTVSVTRVVVMPMLAQAAPALALLAALFALRLWGADRRRGTDERWLSLPVSETSLVLGQWLAHALLLVACAVLAGAYALALRLGAPVDFGVIASAVLGLVMLGLFATALAGAWSAGVTHPGLACLLTLLTLVALWAPDAAALARGDGQSPLAWVALSRRLHPLLNGEVRLADLAFFAGAAAAALGLWHGAMTRRRGLRRLDGLSAGMLAGGALLIAGHVTDLRWDLTRLARHTVPAPVQEFLADLDGPVELVAIAGPTAPALADFIARVRRHKPDLTLETVDPRERPDRVLALALEPGELLLRHGGRSTRLRTVSYAAFANALARLTRPAPARIAYAFGSGERDLRGQANHDWGAFGVELARVGVDPVPLDLALTPAVPENIDLLIVAAGDAAPLPGSDSAIAAYLDRGGNLWWSGEGRAARFYGRTLAALGLSALPGVVVDARAADRGAADPRLLEIRRFPIHPITRDLGNAALLPIVSAWALPRDGPWRATTIVASGPGSWNETAPVAGALAPDGPEERRGPLPLLVALERAGIAQRVVVSGDGDFPSNRFLGNGVNAELGVRIVRWLLGDDQRVAVPVRLEPDRTLSLTRAQVGGLGVVLLGAIPGALLMLAGLLKWRRARA